MIIVGAGLSGIIAGHYFKNQNPSILEKQMALPNNHNALLRFRTDKVPKLTNIPFAKGTVRKCIFAEGQFAYEPNPYLANTYSLKVMGEINDRSIWDLSSDTRYVAPPDFVQQAAWPLKIQFGHDKTGFLNPGGEPIISTIPMPALMDMVGWKPKPDFRSLPIWSVQAKITHPKVNVFQTIYYPSFSDSYYRASISGDVIIVEYFSEPDEDKADKDMEKILGDFGIIASTLVFAVPGIKKHIHGKIAPIDEEARQQFIYTMTREYNVYSLGRFATWRQILLDDVVDDCKVIEKLMASEGKRRLYHQSLAVSKKGN
jgi:hypothetical protein